MFIEFMSNNIIYFNINMYNIYTIKKFCINRTFKLMLIMLFI